MVDYRIWFDRFQRYRATVDLIQGLAGSNSLEILDVGGYDHFLSTLLPGHRVKLWTEHVLSSSHGLPLEDKAVDVALALDVLEHVAPDERPFFISELARVCRLACIFAFPIASASAVEEFVLKLTGSKYLAEHQEYGLPDSAEMERIFQELGLTYSCHPNASLASWMAMMLLMYGVQDEAVRGEITQFFDQNLYPYENREPVYRYVYLCRPAGSPVGPDVS